MTDNNYMNQVLDGLFSARKMNKEDKWKKRCMFAYDVAYLSAAAYAGGLTAGIGTVIMVQSKGVVDKQVERLYDASATKLATYDSEKHLKRKATILGKKIIGIPSGKTDITVASKDNISSANKDTPENSINGKTGITVASKDNISSANKDTPENSINGSRYARPVIGNEKRTFVEVGDYQDYISSHKNNTVDSDTNAGKENVNEDKAGINADSISADNSLPAENQPTEDIRLDTKNNKNIKLVAYRRIQEPLESERLGLAAKGNAPTLNTDSNVDKVHDRTASVSNASTPRSTENKLEPDVDSGARRKKNVKLFTYKNIKDPSLVERRSSLESQRGDSAKSDNISYASKDRVPFTTKIKSYIAEHKTVKRDLPQFTKDTDTSSRAAKRKSMSFKSNKDKKFIDLVSYKESGDDRSRG